MSVVQFFEQRVRGKFNLPSRKPTCHSTPVSEPDLANRFSNALKYASPRNTPESDREEAQDAGVDLRHGVRSGRLQLRRRRQDRGQVDCLRVVGLVHRRHF